MELQEKINKRIEQLEVELEQINSEYRKLEADYDIRSSMDNYYGQLDSIEWRIEMTLKCILELKQLLN